MFNPQTITDLLSKRNIQVKDFLKKSGISKQTYYNLINTGGGNVSTIEKIADFFNLSIDYFFERENTKISVNGDKNQIGNGNVIVESQAAEIEHLKQLLEEKENMIQEKERTIQLLISKDC